MLKNIKETLEFFDITGMHVLVLTLVIVVALALFLHGYGDVAANLLFGPEHPWLNQ